MKNELDPDFVVMAQCYARDARKQRTRGRADSGFKRTGGRRRRLGAVGIASSVEEIKRARALVEGPFSFMKGKMPRYLSLEEHMALGIHIAWLPGFTHHVLWAALWDFMNDFQSRGIAAWEDFVASRRERPYPEPTVGQGGEGAAMQQRLEELYSRRH